MKVATPLMIMGLMSASCVTAFTTITPQQTSSTTTTLNMGLFDGKAFGQFASGGSGKDRLDEEWEKQQEILANRRKPQSERNEYFAKIEKQREKASKEQSDMWSWQTKNYDFKKGEDPLNEWKKRRADGRISDLENQYGDPKKIGGIPLPGASFGVGGEFGVGGKFDNGGRFDLRLPYADQGYVDEDADVMKKLSNFFGGGNKKREAAAEKAAALKKEEESKKKKGGWPW